MNEAMSDIFGAFVESVDRGGSNGTLAVVDSNTLLVGEEVIARGAALHVRSRPPTARRRTTTRERRQPRRPLQLRPRQPRLLPALEGRHAPARQVDDPGAGHRHGQGDPHHLQGADRHPDLDVEVRAASAPRWSRRRPRSATTRRPRTRSAARGRRSVSAPRRRPAAVAAAAAAVERRRHHHDRRHADQRHARHQPLRRDRRPEVLVDRRPRRPDHADVHDQRRHRRRGHVRPDRLQADDLRLRSAARTRTATRRPARSRRRAPAPTG